MGCLIPRECKGLCLLQFLGDRMTKCSNSHLCVHFRGYRSVHTRLVGKIKGHDRIVHVFQRGHIHLVPQGTTLVYITLRPTKGNTFVGS